MREFNWQCPFCGHHGAITEERYHAGGTVLKIKNREGDRHFSVQCIVCPNNDCRRFTLKLVMSDCVSDGMGKLVPQKAIRSWKLIPGAEMKVLPEYVPEPIVQDYEEACAIVDSSSKASATLARRCLQGMIRDFWKIKKKRLIDEIKALESKVEPLTWKAIDAVRKVGNIGAHMEKDINVIVDVDPDEARKLIGLIELLVDDWYVARHQRQERLESITRIAEKKDAEKKAKPKSEPEGIQA